MTNRIDTSEILLQKSAGARATPVEIKLESLREDAAAVARSDVVEKILQAVCDQTGMRFAAVARVTDDRWLACAVRDELSFGLAAGDELDVHSTLCKEVGACGQTIAIDHVSQNATFRDHHTPKIYGFESYISTPIRRNGLFFGTLCALDPKPANPSDPAIRATVELFADLIGRHLEADALLGRSAALVELGDRFRNIDDPEQIAFAAAEILGRTLGVTRSGYAMIDDQAETATVHRDWAVPSASSIAGTHAFRDYGTFFEDLKRGEPVIVADCDIDPRTAVRSSAMRRIGARAIVNIPVVEQGKLVAIFYLHSEDAREWAPDEIVFIRDIADRTRIAIERRRAERALENLTETLERQVAERSAALRLFENIVQSDSSPVCAFDRDFRLIAFNRAHNDEFRRVNGFDTKIGDVFPELFIEDQQPIMRELMSRALSGERFTVIEEFGRPELGTPYWEITYTPLRDETGAIIGAFHHAKDVSARLAAQAELSRTQDALRQSQKLESMGQLTGGVAHDFNNLLTPIIGSLDMLVRKGLGGDRERRLIDGALQSAERAKTLVQRLLAFARRQPLQPRAVDLAQVISGMAGLIRSTIGPTIDVQVKLDQQAPAAHADPNQLEMALLNLAMNARDAMPVGGVLKIETKFARIAAPHRSGLPAADYVLLCVADDGTGMDEATRARAIEPFFSTKGIGKGTGLGLSMVHGLAAQLGGGLIIDSSLGEGTTIELWLPVSSERGEVDETAPATSVKPHRRGRALLVDDEPLVRMSTADMLAELGFDVIEAASAEEALQHLAGGTQYDVLITDHLMPGMNGADLARQLSHSQPSLPVLIVSGYAEADGVSFEFPRLIKPFRSLELSEMLGKLLPV